GPARWTGRRASLAAALLRYELGPILARRESKMIARLVATILNRLAQLSEERSEYGHAAQEYQRAVSLLAQARPGMVRDRLRVQVLGNLANLYRVQGHYEQSATLYHDVLTLAQRLYGPGALQLAVLRTNLAVLYKYQGRFSEAERLYRQALASMKQTL